MLTLLFLLQLKHLVIDWILQPRWMWANKGTYGHWGGIVHAWFNAVGTAACFSLFVPFDTVVLILVIDFLAHYHIDWAKMNINKITGWGPTTHPEFWWLTGFDQFLHQITYIGLLAYV
jgi:Protein of unknown function (DUF3307)